VKTIIRELRPEDVGKYADLCEARDGLDRKGAEERAQQVAFMAFENPTKDGQPHYFVAETGDRLTGHMGRMPTWFWVDGKKHLATFAHDLFVHQDLQRTGQAFFVTMKLYQAVEKACASFCAMVWTNQINIELQQSRKYDQLWVHRYVHLLRADTQLQRIEKLGPAREVAKPLARVALKAVDDSLRIWHRSRPAEQIETFDRRFDLLAERIGPKMGIAPVKDAAYLNFKYVHRPFIDTVCFGLPGRGGELLGFVVLRKLGTEFVGTILELCADREDTATILSLLHCAIDYYRRAGATSVETVASDPAFISALKRTLFMQRMKLPLFFANGQKYSNPEVLRRLEAWHHCSGDSEGPY
jgi:GNAT superfamily N-acetyltransferase